MRAIQRIFTPLTTTTATKMAPYTSAVPGSGWSMIITTGGARASSASTSRSGPGSPPPRENTRARVTITTTLPSSEGWNW